jgi:hypothetical protein
VLHATLYTSIAILLLTWGGNVICRAIFNLTGLKDATADEEPPGHVAGRVIGTLERLILALGILMNSWEILAAVIALKTVARFQQLDKREFAEYFLVGSLFSVFWSIIISSAWLAYDNQLGIDLHQKMVALISVEEKSND